MWVKRKDLEQLVEAIDAELRDHNAKSLTGMWEAVLLGNRLLRALPAPVDAVPVHDYPFPLPVTEGPSK